MHKIFTDILVIVIFLLFSVVFSVVYKDPGGNLEDDFIYASDENGAQAPVIFYTNEANDVSFNSIMANTINSLFSYDDKRVHIQDASSAIPFGCPLNSDSCTGPKNNCLSAPLLSEWPSQTLTASDP